MVCHQIRLRGDSKSFFVVEKKKKQKERSSMWACIVGMMHSGDAQCNDTNWPLKKFGGGDGYC